MLALMSNALSERDAQRRMLEKTEDGTKTIEKVKKDHYMHIKTAERYMEDLVKFAMKLDLPPQLKDLGAQAFPEVFNRLSQIRKVDPTKLVEAGCSFAPTATYELKKLRKQGFKLAGEKNGEEKEKMECAEAMEEMKKNLPSHQRELAQQKQQSGGGECVVM